MAKAATPELRRELVLASIKRINAARHEWEKAARDPRASAKTVTELSERYHSTEYEFRWQWENVEALLEEKSCS